MSVLRLLPIGVFILLDYASRLLMQVRKYFNVPILIVLLAFFSIVLLASNVYLAIFSILLFDICSIVSLAFGTFFSLTFGTNFLLVIILLFASFSLKGVS